MHEFQTVRESTANSKDDGAQPPAPAVYFNICLNWLIDWLISWRQRIQKFSNNRTQALTVAKLCNSIPKREVFE